MTETDMELKLMPWRNLANAIIEQAAKDYMAAQRKLKRFPENYRAKTQVAELEQFFRSDWYGELTDVDGERLIKLLKRGGTEHDSEGVFESGIQARSKD